MLSICQLTLSLHIKLRRVSPYTPLLSYATEDSDNEILIGMKQTLDNPKS